MKIQTLKKRSDFLRLRSGKRYSSKTLLLQGLAETLKEETNECRVGYTVTTKVGNSVVRSRIKRRLREAVRRVIPEKAKSGFDYVLIGKRDALTQDFASIVKDLELALDHVHRNGAKGTTRHRN